MFTKNNNIKIKRLINGKINIYSCCNDCSFKMFSTINEEEISDLLKKASFYYKTILSYRLN